MDTHLYKFFPAVGTGRGANKSWKAMPTAALLVFLLLVCLSTANAQQRRALTPKEAVLLDAQAEQVISGSEKVRMDLDGQRPLFVRFKPNEAPAFADFGALTRKLFKVGGEYELRPIRTQKDQIGYTHYRYQQYYRGVPVEGAIFIAHVKKDRVMSMNGDFENKLQLAVQPSLSRQKCLANALGHVKAEEYMWEKVARDPVLKSDAAHADYARPPVGELVIVDKNQGTGRPADYRLAYKFDIYASIPHERKYVYVDAKTGAVVAEISRIHHHGEEEGMDDVDDIGACQTKYSGNRNFTTDDTGNPAPNRFRLYQAGRKIHTRNNNGNAEYYDDNNVWIALQIGNNQPALDCHWGTERTYDYFLNTFGLNSFDGNGAQINSFLNDNSLGAQNAFWNGSNLRYGSGVDGKALTSLDIIGHEFTHAVTEYASGLIYSSESGALNESFSDIFGTTVEFFAKPNFSTGNWTLGEDPDFIIRNMANPNEYYQPDTYLGDYWSPSAGAVHTNSGVQNFWFYLLTIGGSGANDNGDNYNVSGIGMDKAAAITYRNLSFYLTPNSDYADAAFYAIESAADLYDCTSMEVTQTVNAWNAVGVASVMPSCCEPPEAMCKDMTVNLDAMGEVTITYGNIDNGSTAPCGLQSANVSPDMFACTQAGTTQSVTLLITDVNGASDQCTAMVTVRDVTPPTALCKDITVQLDGQGEVTINAGAVDNGSSDKCDFGLSLDKMMFNCADVGPNAVTLTATDLSNNSDDCTATVTVLDLSPPKVSCSGGSLFFNGEDEFPVTDAVTASATDACGDVTITYSPSVITCEQVGESVAVIVTAMDAGGNMAKCTTYVQVNGFPCGFIDTYGVGCTDQGAYNAATGTFSVQTNGCNHTNPNSDQVGFISYELCGNGSISFRVAGVSSANVFAGITLRAGLDPGDIKAEVVTNRLSTGRGAVRESTNGSAWPQPFFLSGRHWLKMERLGNQVRVYSSTNGLSWTILMVRNLTLPNCVQVGLIAYGPGKATATFDNVTVNGVNVFNGSSSNKSLTTGGETPTPFPLPTSNFRLQVYPNPTWGRVTLYIPADLPLENAALEVLDTYGRSLLRETVLDDRRELNLSHLPAGTYFVRLQTATGERLIERVVVQPRS